MAEPISIDVRECAVAETAFQPPSSVAPANVGRHRRSDRTN